MSQDTKYTGNPFVFISRGIMAKPSTDRPPGPFYLNLDNCFEREEEAMSIRYGNQIINRDPFGGGTQNNYLLPSAPVILSRLRSLNIQTYRYAALASGALYRRATDIQGQYSQIATGLSGKRFSTLVNTLFQSSLPYLFLYDSQSPLKDNGTGNPTRIGIFPPVVPVTSLQYAPQFSIIDNFGTTAGYGPSGMSLVGQSTIATVAGTAGSPQLSGNYEQYTDATNSFVPIPDGMIALSVSNPDGTYRQKFFTNSVNQTYNIVSPNNVYSATDSFTFKAVSFSIAANTTGFIGKTIALNLGNYQSDDLIIVAIQVNNPSAVQEIRVMFDINGGGYTSSYYYKSVIPVSYQGSVSIPQNNDPTTAMITEVFNRAAGVTNLAQDGYPQLLPKDDTSLAGIQPSQMTSGANSWSILLLRKGDFLPVGNAGDNGMDWSNVTGWRVQVTTNSNGSATLAFNGIYIQGSPTSNGVGTNAGPSSYGGLGYDYRYIYWNNNTGTPSNPSWTQLFSQTQLNPAGQSTLVVLRQAINVSGQYSADPQVTHVRIYRRGGLFGDNWRYLDQIPNIVGSGTFNYKDILPDSAVVQGNILGLANDVPVTSTLQNPINTTLTGALNPTPANLNRPTLLTVNVAGTPTFVPNQVVVIGTPQNLEQVAVIGGGTGSFQAYIMLPHAANEQVQAFSLPGVACNLAAAAYNQTWLAGDPNNPHYLYYTPVGYPDNCPPQNYIPVGTAANPITAVINFDGVLFVRTTSRWWRIFPGSPPYAQSTGSQHGSPANFDWCLTEKEIWYQSWDGIRSFAGADSPYRSLIIEWLYRNNNITPIPLVNTSTAGLSSVVSAFHNNTAYFVYLGQDGNNHRLAYRTPEGRWRNDDIAATAILNEEDTNTLVMSIPMTIGGVSGWAVVTPIVGQDFDDGGWVGGALVQLPISFTLQTPYFDQGAINNQKQYNDVAVDCNPNGQTLTATLFFDDNNGTVAPIVLGTMTGNIRNKFQFGVNGALGQQAYRVSLAITGSVIAAPITYQAHIESAILAEQRTAYDTYWIKAGIDESKLIKQGYFDYTAPSPITVNLYSDGSLVPYYTFTLPANPNRLQVPERVRFVAKQLRLFRMTMTSVGQFQLWVNPQIDQKPLLGPGAKGYERTEVVTE